MKRIYSVIFLIFLPTILFSQWSNWSISASVAGGISEVDNPSTKFYKKDSKGKIGADMALTVRYSIWRFYASSGIGFQTFKSQCGYTMTSTSIRYNELNPDLSYSNLYIPVYVGFKYNRWRVYPVAEAGINVNFPIGLKDRVVIGNDITDVVGNPKAVTFSYVAQGGVGFAFSQQWSLEAKFKYLKSLNVSEDKESTGKDYKSTWTFMGGQVSMVLRF